MIKLNQNSLTAMLLALLVSLVLPLRAGAQTTEPSLPTIRIVLVGDSTVATQSGWGNGFIADLSDRAQVTNMARNGRSSKSFINEGWWKKSLDLKPDYVLIQFGHNDQKPDAARSTDPKTTYRQYMTQYIDDARAAGIKPILVTSVSRRQWGPDGKIHSTLVPYVDVVKEIAQEKGVTLIDLHAKSIELYEKLGKAEVETMSPSKPATAPSDDPSQKEQTVFDGTHFNKKGGAVIGKVVAEELAKAVPELAAYIKSSSNK